jgi:hypothetical protein
MELNAVTALVLNAATVCLCAAWSSSAAFAAEFVAGPSCETRATADLRPKHPARLAVRSTARMGSVVRCSLPQFMIERFILTTSELSDNATLHLRLRHSRERLLQFGEVLWIRDRLGIGRLVDEAIGVITSGLC